MRASFSCEINKYNKYMNAIRTSSGERNVFFFFINNFFGQSKKRCDVENDGYGTFFEAFFVIPIIFRVKSSVSQTELRYVADIVFNFQNVSRKIQVFILTKNHRKIP